MTTVKSWDYYPWEEQQRRIREQKIVEQLVQCLEASISTDTAWGITDIFVHQRINTLGCKSYLLSYLLQKCGLKDIRVSKQQSDLIKTKQYKYAQIKWAFTEITKHPEWIEEFKEKTRNTKLYDFTFTMDEDELRRYY